MASLSLPHSSQSLPPIASAVAIPTIVAPTVGREATGLRSAARPYSLIGRPFATGPFFYVQPSSFMLASMLVMHAVMLAIGRINLYVDLTAASDPGDLPPRSIPILGVFNHTNL